MNSSIEIAVLIPCLNEERAIAHVVKSFREIAPTYKIYVYDNNSTDNTIEEARNAGAIVRTAKHQGKGNVIQLMFAEIEADVYILIDGDGTYEVNKARIMVDALLNDSADMVVGVRKHLTDNAYRKGHQFGNFLFNKLIEWTFREKVTDIFSGYRVLSRRFVKSFPITSTGFEIETELTIHALSLKCRTIEIDTIYVERMPGSFSKLRTYSDGFSILVSIASFIRNEKPFYFFSLVGCFLGLASVSLGAVVIAEFIETKYITRVPTAILVTGLMISSIVCFTAGIILSSVSLARNQAKRLAYLSIK